MTAKLIRRRCVPVGLIIALVLVQVAIGGCVCHVLRPSIPRQAAVDQELSQPESTSTASGLTSDSGVTLMATGETVEEKEIQDAVSGPLIPATDIGGLARAFDEEQAQEHIAYLASGELEGRQPGSPGGRAAGNYIAEHFAAYGLEPAGVEGTYYQTFTVPYGRITSLPRLDIMPPGEARSSNTYEYGVDYRALTGGYVGAGEGAGPVIWLNQCRHEDYDGLSMVGKIVLCRASSDPTVYREAIAHRVGGLLLLDRDRGSEPFRRGGYRETAWVPEPIPAYRISDRVGQDLLIGTDYTLDGLGLHFSATPLSTTVRMRVTTNEDDEVTARNVLGLLPGSDPVHAADTVVIGAHYDHLGPEPDGTIMNGANDNASGVGALLEIARVWQAEGFRPERSVLFAAWDGEEQGLLGSQHYTELPTQSITRTVSMLNLDMVGAGETLQIDGEGSVAAQLAMGAETYGVTYTSTSTVHGRSDHAPFVASGVPASMLIWWPDAYYHTTEDKISIIEPEKLKASGVLASHTLAAMAGGQVEIEHAVDRLQSSVAQRDREAFVAMLDPSDPDLRASQVAWFDDLWSRGLADISVQAEDIRFSEKEALVTLNMAPHWSDETAPERSVSYPAHFTEYDGTWRFSGPDLEEVADRGVTVAVLAGSSVDARDLLSTTRRVYVSLAADLGQRPVAGTRFIYYRDEEMLCAIARPASRTDVGWLVPSAELAQIAVGLTAQESITPAVVSLVLTQMGLPPGEGEWLREGVFARYKVDAAAAYMPALVDADLPSPLLTSAAAQSPSQGGSATGRMSADRTTAEDEVEVPPAHAWSATDYLLERYGTEGLRDLCVAWGRHGSTDAFEEALGITAEEFEAAWHDARIRPLQEVSAGIQAAIAQREAAVLEGDEDDFLSTVALSDSVLRAEERHLFAELTERSTGLRVISYSVAGNVVGWTPLADEAEVVLTTSVVVSGGHSSRVTHNARFVRELGHWRYAGWDWSNYASEHFLLRIGEEDPAWAEHVLTQAEEVYERVTADLLAQPPLPQQIKLYADEGQFRASIASPPLEGDSAWTAKGQSIRLWVNRGNDPSVREALACGLTQQVLLAQGVESDWIHAGVTALETDRLLPLGVHWGSVAREPLIREALGSRQMLDWSDLRAFDPLPVADQRLARAQSWSLVAKIVEDHGLRGLQRCIAEAVHTSDPESILRNALGVDSEAFLQEWKEGLQSPGAPDDLTALARRFDTDRALEHVEVLSSPECEGREAGSPGAQKAAAYIAEQFLVVGLEPFATPLTGTLAPTATAAPTAWPGYYQQFPISYTHLMTIPALTLLDSAPGTRYAFGYRRDFVEVAGGGVGEGELVWLPGTDLEGLRFDGAVVVERNVDDPWRRACDLADHGASGLIVLAGWNSGDLETRGEGHEGEGIGETIPVFGLSEDGTNALLETLGLTPEVLSSAPRALPLHRRARMVIPRAPVTTTQTANVLGVLPGSDSRLADEVLVLGAHYDHVGRLPGGQYFPGANRNASGVATMLEIGRLWQAAGYRPRRTVLFAAWGGEERDSAGVRHYLQDPISPLTRTVGVISLDSIADGDGFRLWFWGDGDEDGPLTHRLEASASQLDGEAWRKGSTDRGWHALFSNEMIPSVKLAWAESDELSYRLDDTADAIDPHRLANSGKIVALAISWLAGR